MSNAINFVLFIVPWLLVTGAYAAAAGLTYGPSKVYFDRYTSLDKEDSVRLAAVSAAVFWLSVPFMILARFTGLTDPVNRAEKRALEAEEAAERQTRISNAETRLEGAKFREEVMLRQRQRLIDPDLPYTAEEAAMLKGQGIQLPLQLEAGQSEPEPKPEPIVAKLPQRGKDWSVTGTRGYQNGMD